MLGEKRKRSEQFLKPGEGPLEGGVRRHNAASRSYLLHLPSPLFLSCMIDGGRADEAEG